MATLSRTVLILTLLLAGLLTIVFSAATQVSGHSSVDVTEFGYKQGALLVDCQHHNSSNINTTTGSGGLDNKLIQAVKNETQSTCHCPFSTTVLTPFNNTQLIDVIGIQLSSLALFRDDQLGKTHRITEQPYRPPIA